MKQRTTTAARSTILLADASKAERKLGWKPRTSFKELIRLMMETDLELAVREQRAGAGPGVSRHG